MGWGLDLRAVDLWLLVDLKGLVKRQASYSGLGQLKKKD